MIYYIVLVIIYIFSIFNIKNRYIENIIFYLIGIFLCTTYFNGSDWRQYENFYYIISINNFHTMYFKKGYALFTAILKFFNVEFFHFFIVTKLIIFFVFKKIIFDRADNKYLTLGLFYSFMAMYLFIDCPFRNLIAIGIILYIQNYLIKKEIFKYFLGILLATSFHNSAFIFIIMIFIPKKLKKSCYCIFIISIFLFLSNKYMLMSVLEKLPLFEERIVHYFNSRYDVTKILSIGCLEKIIVVSLLIFSTKTKDWEKKKLFQIIVYFLLYRIGLTFKFLARYSFYFQIFYLIELSNLITYNRNLKKYIIITLLFLYELIQINRVLYKNYEYIPYTSYFKYIFKEKPSFSYRYKYNVLKYIERNGNDEEMEKRLKRLNNYEINEEN